MSLDFQEVRRIAWETYDERFGTVSVVDHGAVGDGSTNDASAIQAAIDAAFVTGGVVYFPPGTYNIGTTTLVFKNKVSYRGAGKDNTRSKGTLISYTGTSDAIQINNPIDSSTAAEITVEDMWVHCTARTAGKAAIADVGSTFLSINRVGVSGNDYGIILDQSELTDIDQCDIEVTATSSTAGIWIVNGDEHTTGADTQYTNRISIKRCQFNSAVASTVSILDDGGVTHVFEDNNYNGFATHIRSCGATGLSIRGGEFEGATGANIIFSNVTTGAVGKGQSIGVEIGGSAVIVPTAGQSCISITSVGDITFGKVYMGNTAAAKVASIANCNTCIDTGGIYNAGGGSTFGGNRASRHLEINPSIGLAGTAVIDTNIGIRSASATAGIGYTTGAGGTVTQLTSKATTVELNKVTGEITMDGTILNADTTVSFTLTNSGIAAGDHVVVQHVSGGTVGSYLCTAVSAGGSATVYVRNITAGNLTEVPVLKFSVIKAVTS